MTAPDPHLLPDGSTSWGPDPDGLLGQHVKTTTERATAADLEAARRGPDPSGEVDERGHGLHYEEAVPEPTEAMLEAMDRTTPERARREIERVIAAAPPEWLLRAALGERALCLISEWGDMVQSGYFRDQWSEADSILLERIRRALRGGEDT